MYPTVRITRLLLALTWLAGSGGCNGEAPAGSVELAAQGVYAGALSSNSELAVIGSLNHGASLWRNTDHERLFNWNHQPEEFSALVAARFSADGSRAVTSEPRTLVVWDTRNGAAIAYWTTPAKVRDVALAPSGRQVLMGLDDHSAVLFDTERGNHLQTFLHEAAVASVAISNNGEWALTGSEDESAAVWQLPSGREVQRLAHDNPVTLVALSATGRYAFSAAQGRQLTVWEAASGTPLHTLSERNTGATSAGFSADESQLLIGYVNHRVELWDVASGRLLQTWNTPARNPWHPTGAAIIAVEFSSTTNTYFAIAGDGRLVELRRS